MDDDSHGDPFETSNMLSLATSETPDLLSVSQLLDSVSLLCVLLIISFELRKGYNNDDMSNFMY